MSKKGGMFALKLQSFRRETFHFPEGAAKFPPTATFIKHKYAHIKSGSLFLRASSSSFCSELLLVRPSRCFIQDCLTLHIEVPHLNLVNHSFLMVRSILTAAQRVVSSLLFGSTVVLTVGLGYGLYNIHQHSKSVLSLNCSFLSFLTVCRCAQQRLLT